MDEVTIFCVESLLWESNTEIDIYDGRCKNLFRSFKLPYIISQPVTM
jgi:hypothetical protein